MAKPKTPTKNVHWQDLGRNAEIEDTGKMFLAYKNGTPHAVVFWHGQESKRAQAWLSSMAFGRCGADGCGVRVEHAGDKCGTHERGQPNYGPAHNHDSEMVECAYCSAMVAADEGAPDADDDEAWEEIASTHTAECEWVATRAHRLD